MYNLSFLLKPFQSGRHLTHLGSKYKYHLLQSYLYATLLLQKDPYMLLLLERSPEDSAFIKNMKSENSSVLVLQQAFYLLAKRVLK